MLGYAVGYVLCDDKEQMAIFRAMPWDSLICHTLGDNTPTLLWSQPLASFERMAMARCLTLGMYLVSYPPAFPAKDELISVMLTYCDFACRLFVASLVNGYWETDGSCVSGGCLPRIVIAALMFDAAVCTLLSYLSFLLHFLKKIIFLLVLDNSVMHVITTTGLGHCFRSFGGSNVLQMSL